MASLAIFNGMYPAINRSSSAITSATVKVSDRIESRIDIIQVADDTEDVDVWVKNVGASDIDSISRSDVFFGLTSNFSHIDYGGPTTPYWSYELEGDHTDWEPAVTLKITIHSGSTLSAGTYMTKVVIPNGISDEITFGVD